MSSRSMRLRMLCFAIAADIGYALLCTVTDTWKNSPPSEHVSLMLLSAFAGAVVALVLAPGMED